jgi:hypothetical protein
VLGIEFQGDGGLLFALALIVLAASGVVLWLRRPQLRRLERRLRQWRGVRLRTLVLPGLLLWPAAPFTAPKAARVSADVAGASGSPPCPTAGERPAAADGSAGCADLY